MTPSEEAPVVAPRRRRYAIVAVCLLLLGGCGAWLWGLVKEAREAARVTACHGHMFFLGFALQNYHEQEGRFPPAYTADAEGKPLSSWRVLLVQYCEQQPFYEKYNFQGAWDDPANYKLAQDESFNRLFGCPSGPDFRDPRDWNFDPNQPRYTNYVGITGPGTIFPGGGETVSFADITDGPENTILMVEIANSDIHWSEPRDLHIDQMSFKINDPDKPSISSPHPAGPGVVFADGRYSRITKSMPPEVLRGLMTINGGEKLTRDQLVSKGYLTR